MALKQRAKSDQNRGLTNILQEESRSKRGKGRNSAKERD